MISANTGFFSGRVLPSDKKKLKKIDLHNTILIANTTTDHRQGKLPGLIHEHLSFITYKFLKCISVTSHLPLG